MFPSRARRMLRELWAAAVDGVCPPVCPGCGVVGPGLCAGCAHRLQWRRPPVCGRCGVPLVAATAACREPHRRLDGLWWVRAPFGYAGTGGTLVRRAKFQADRAALAYLARAMVDSLAPLAAGPGRRLVLVPVPLHPRKRRYRGIDQAALLADWIGGRLGLASAPTALRRVRDTLPQGDVRVTSRRANVAGAFAVRRGRQIRDRTVVLVDDVRTSGSTAAECGRVLRAAGARRVALLTATQA